MATANGRITIALTLEIDERTRAALVALGWTPPDEDDDVEKADGFDDDEEARCLYCAYLITRGSAKSEWRLAPGETAGGVDPFTCHRGPELRHRAAR